MASYISDTLMFFLNKLINWFNFDAHTWGARLEVQYVSFSVVNFKRISKMLKHYLSIPYYGIVISTTIYYNVMFSFTLHYYCKL